VCSTIAASTRIALHWSVPPRPAPVDGSEQRLPDRASDGDVDEAAGYLGLTARQVRAALDYYADFRDEVDADAEAAHRTRPMGAPAASPGVKLALDHHYSPRIAIQLRKRRCDVIAVIERGWEHEDDEPLLALCTGETRALLTNNVADFTVIARRWALEGRQHAGLSFTSDASMPRGRHTIGRYVTALQTLLRANPADNAFVDRPTGSDAAASPRLPSPLIQAGKNNCVPRSRHPRHQPGRRRRRRVQRG
jgi:hypothetical protein